MAKIRYFDYYFETTAPSTTTTTKPIQMRAKLFIADDSDDKIGHEQTSEEGGGSSTIIIVVVIVVVIVLVCLTIIAFLALRRRSGSSIDSKPTRERKNSMISLSDGESIATVASDTGKAVKEEQNNKKPSPKSSDTKLTHNPVFKPLAKKNIKKW